MTVEDTYVPTRTVGNGVTTAFSFGANVEASSEIVVNLILTATNVKTLQVDPDDYTIVLNTTTEGGTINFVTAPLSTQEVLTERLVAYDQNNNIPDVGDIRESQIEGADDKLTRLVQQLRELSDRSAKLTVEGSTKFPAFVNILPDPVSNAIIAFNNVPDGYRAVTLAALSAIALPINSGIAVFQGGNTFASVKLSNIGNATIINANGVAGNPTINTSLTDFAVSNIQLSIASQGANLVGYDNTISGLTASDVKAAIDEIIVGDKFQMDAGREATVSTTHGAPTTVNFNGTFDEPPIVICTSEDTTVRAVAVLNVTTTNFTAFGTAAVPFNWVAFKAGTFDLGSGIIVQAGVFAVDSANNAAGAHVFQTGKTPSICCSSMAENPASFVPKSYRIVGRLYGSDASGANTNFAGRSSQILCNSGVAPDDEMCAFILITQTGAVQSGNAATAVGAQGVIGATIFEAGTVLNTTSLTPALTFQTAFGVAPICLVQSDSRNIAGTPGDAALNAQPTTAGLVARLSSTSTDHNYNWMAFESGFVSLTTVRRIG